MLLTLPILFLFIKLPYILKRKYRTNNHEEKRIEKDRAHTIFNFHFTNQPLSSNSCSSVRVLVRQRSIIALPLVYIYIYIYIFFSFFFLPFLPFPSRLSFTPITDISVCIDYASGVVQPTCYYRSRRIETRGWNVDVPVFSTRIARFFSSRSFQFQPILTSRRNRRHWFASFSKEWGRVSNRRTSVKSNFRGMQMALVEFLWR